MTPRTVPSRPLTRALIALALTVLAVIGGGGAWHAHVLRESRAAAQRVLARLEAEGVLAAHEAATREQADPSARRLEELATGMGIALRPLALPRPPSGVAHAPIAVFDERWDSPEARAWLLANEARLDLVVEHLLASDPPRWEATPGGVGAPYPNVAGHSMLIAALLRRASSDSDPARAEAALDAAMALATGLMDRHEYIAVSFGRRFVLRVVQHAARTTTRPATWSHRAASIDMAAASRRAVDEGLAADARHVAWDGSPPVPWGGRHDPHPRWDRALGALGMGLAGGTDVEQELEVRDAWHAGASCVILRRLDARASREGWRGIVRPGPGTISVAATACHVEAATETLDRLRRELEARAAAAPAPTALP